MRALPVALTVLAVAAPTASAAVPNGGRLSVHLRRTAPREITITGRAPAYSDVTVKLLNGRGGFRGYLRGGAGRKHHYAFYIGAPHGAVRAVVTVEVRHGKLRSRSGLLPAAD